MSVISVPSAASEALPGASSGAPPEEAGAAPFAQVLAKAAAAGPGDRAANAKPQAAAAAKPAAGQGQDAAPLAAVLAAMLPEPAGAPPGQAEAPRRESAPEKDRAPPMGQGGNGLPPLAVPLMLASPLQKPAAPGAGGAQATSAPVGDGLPRAQSRIPGEALLPGAVHVDAKTGYPAVAAGVQQLPAAHGAEAGAPAPVVSTLRQAPEAGAPAPLDAAQAGYAAAAPSRAEAAPGALPAAGAAQLPWMPPTANAQPAAPQATVAAPLASPHWAQDLGAQLLIGIQGNAQTLTLHVNPPQLGPLQVHLQVSDGQASALFVSPHLAVRQALEGAMPQLRDIFAGAGMGLLQAQVSADGGGARRDPPRQGGRAHGALPVGEEESASGYAYWRAGFVNTYV